MTWQSKWALKLSFNEFNLILPNTFTMPIRKLDDFNETHINGINLCSTNTVIFDDYSLLKFKYFANYKSQIILLLNTIYN